MNEMKLLALFIYALIAVNFGGSANSELKRFTAKPANFSLVLVDESKQRDDFFKHLKYLTSRFVDYKFFCSSEINLKSQYAILDDDDDLDSNRRNLTVHELNKRKQSSFTKSLRTTNIWVLRNKKCMNFSDVTLTFNEANSVCVRNNYKVTRMLHRNEMKFLLKNGKDHYKGIDIYALYAKLNRVRRVKQQPTSLRKKSNKNKKLRQKSALRRTSSKRKLVLMDQRKKRRRENEEEQPDENDENGGRNRNKNDQQNCDDDENVQQQQQQLVQEFNVWLNDDNYLTGDECLSKSHAPVVRFNQRECRNGCFECALRNATRAYFVCVKNCDWKVPYNSFCNTMNRNDLYLYENLYYQRDELIYLCQGQLECIDYACK